ncbi:enoyl-CoA hydratase/isomerase family protein [Sphingopyxis sp. JAI128]|uniref:enoyl-CoA hydratase/isomerase family protein n=1 Tax=Sphingopyxis sp. JAI128 TaxID=2723066 RepID=UPI00161A130D|nr:enoyl-CoA hydratase-related protein [Sphingopyxis sp. JAI128]MBB6427901.1 enoyl-CoA hydratase [Sphingopyxis sp. JAI128]
MILPEFETIEMSRRGRILTIMLNRPDKLNAFDAALHRELPKAIDFASHDPGSDIIILTGAGRAFSAGGDMNWQQDGYDEPARFEVTVREARQIIFGLIDCEKPVIARINGPAVGLGATIALFCDISFMAQSTYISDPHVSVGMVAGDGGAVIWPQLIGFARAKEYLLTGDRILAPAAAQMGLVNHAVHDDELDQRVDAFADRLASGAQQAIRYSKLTMNVALRQLAASIMDVGLGYESLTNISDDHREALLAFREKRPPRFGPERPS